MSFIPDHTIETLTENLRADYGRAFSPILVPPIPVEAILENYLRYSFEFAGLVAELGVQDVLGITRVMSRTVVVDQYLDPGMYPDQTGRYLFTVAHEIGHIVLHVDGSHHKQIALFDEEELDEELGYCRSSDRSPKEIQADLFAGALLMPKEMIRGAWRRHFGSMTQRSYDPDVRARLFRSKPTWPSEKLTSRALEELVEPIAGEFSASREATRIRLERMGLLVRRGARPTDVLV